MTLIEQIENLETYVMKRLGHVRQQRYFKEVAFFKGWGECVRKPAGDTEPLWMSAPSVEVVGNESTPDDDKTSRSITVRVTLATAQSEGCDLHREREKVLDKALGEVNRKTASKAAGTFTRWRWSALRLNAPDTSYETEWTVTVGLDDPLYEC